MTLVSPRESARSLFLLAQAMKASQARRATAVEHEPENVLEWALAYRRIDGQPFTLDRFKPLRAIYEDEHPHVVVMKPAQRGVSEWAINVAAFALELGAPKWTNGQKNGLNVAYIFPTIEALGDFSKERLSGMQRESPHLSALFMGSNFDAVRFKQFGDSFLYLRGGWSESSLLSFSADVLILDEFDRMDPLAISLARKRLNASILRREIDISTPTLPGRGIHAQYLASDQRVYEQPCPRCDAWTSYDFFRDVKVDGYDHVDWQYWQPERILHADVYLACPACHTRLSDDERCSDGRWRALDPSITSLRGYHVPSLCWTFVSLQNLAALAVSNDPTATQEFFRSDLGLPYESKGSRVTESMLRALSSNLDGGKLPTGPHLNATMGVDVGSRYHYRISVSLPNNRRLVVAMGSVGSYDELDRLIAQHKVRQVVIDALPEQHGTMAWSAKHKGKVLRALYPSEKALGGELFHIKHDEDVIQINRTTAMDNVYAAIASGSEDWPASFTNDPEVIAHMKAPVRVTVLDDRGQERAVWEHTTPDHLFHAAVYDRIAASVPRKVLGVFAQGRVRGSMR